MSNNYRGRYYHAELIMEKFIQNNPGVVPFEIIDRAWADIFNSKSLAIAHAENTFIEPLVNIFSALLYDITYLPAWKTLIKIIVRKTR